MKGIADNLGNLRVTEDTFAGACIKPFINFIREELVEFFFLFGRSRLGIFGNPSVLFREEFIKSLLREGVGETPGDQKGCFRALPMREATAVDLGRIFYFASGLRLGRYGRDARAP